MAQTSLAAVFHKPGSPLTLETYELPRLRPGEFLVRITCATLCGSDVHTFLGRRSTPLPTVLGHEIMGFVEAIGPPRGHSCGADQTACDYFGQRLEIGDRITWSIAASCGDCFFCQHNIPQKCVRLFKYGHERIAPDHPLSGGLAEYCHLAAGTAILRLPDTLPDVVACPANCATASIAAGFRVAGNCMGESVLIQGAGMLGLTATAMASSTGAREVIVCDVDAKRLQRAPQFGATETLLIRDDEPELIASVRELTAGRGVDLALELSGSPKAVQIGVRLLRIGGRYVLIGSTFPTPPVALDPESIVRQLVTIVGNHNYTPKDLAEAVRFLSKHGHDFPFADLVHDEFSLHDVEAAFRQAIAGDSLRVAVRPGVQLP